MIFQLRKQVFNVRRHLFSFWGCQSLGAVFITSPPWAMDVCSEDSGIRWERRRKVKWLNHVMSFLKKKIIKWAWHSLIDLEGFRIPWPILSGSTNNLSLSSAPKITREPEEEVKFCCILGIATQMSCRKLRLGRSDPALTPFPSCAPCASLLYVHIALCAPFPSAFSIAVLDAPSHHVTRDEGWNQDVSLGLVSCSGAQTPSPAVLLSNCIVLSESFQHSVPQFPCLWTRVISVYLVGLLCGC